jgi:hypothetical protein
MTILEAAGVFSVLMMVFAIMLLIVEQLPAEWGVVIVLGGCVLLYPLAAWVVEFIREEGNGRW